MNPDILKPVPRIRQAGLTHVFVLALLIVLASAARVHAQPTPHPLEIEARTLYAAGEYRRALDLFAQLYAETTHPTYLRNVGRCQQHLGEADKAIASFREYLRRAKTLDAKGRAEVEGYIREMENLQRARGETAPIDLQPLSAPPAAISPTPPVGPPVPQARHDVPVPAPVAIAAPAPSAAPLPRWLPWVGAAVTAGLATAAVVTTISVSSRLDELQKTCAPPEFPGCSDADVDSLELRGNVRNLLWVLTGAAAVATGVSFYMNHNPQTRQTDLSLRVRF